MSEEKFVILKMDSITKSFSGVTVLDHVSFEILRGEVHCILGENGAGKSTLIKIISGAYQKDSGRILLNGEEVSIVNSRVARELGIGTVYQEMSLVPTLNAVANIFLGNELCKGSKGNGKILDYAAMEARTKELLDRMGVSMNLFVPVQHLSTAQQQIIEIARSLAFNNKIIIMDEPTSSLTDREVKELFHIIGKLKEDGITIIYISHKLEELEKIGDHITILRDGKYINTVTLDKTTMNEIVAMMVGREFDTSRRAILRKNTGEKVLEVKNIYSVDGKVKDVSFSLEKGMILGFAGLVGAGRTELMKVIFGKNKLRSGEIYVNGKKVHNMTTSKAVNMGIAYLTEDRKHEGLVLGLSIKKNITLANMSRICKSLILDLKKETSDSEKMRSELNIVTSSLDKHVVYLSGGNQQKVVVAKWLYSDSDIMIFDEPTRGIDVKARSEIYNIMNRLIDDGKSIIMVSSDLSEILSMSNKIIAMHEGKVIGEVENTVNTTQEQIMKLMLGGVLIHV